MKNNVLVIVGMHRSGTSLTSGWLHLCGLKIGTDLLGKTIANKKGHFEDNDFLNIHEKILKDNGLTYLTTTKDDIKVSEKHYDEIKKIITDKNSVSEQWGWKEPRTCLFLNSVYHQLLPDAKYLIIYRPFEEVVDSLYRRIRNFQNSKTSIQKLYNKIFKVHKIYNPDDLIVPFLETWIRYNLDILAFVSKLDKTQYVLFESQQLIKDNEKIYEVLTNKWGFKLHPYDINNLYEDKLFNKKANSYHFPEELRQKAEDTEKLLEQKIWMNE